MHAYLREDPLKSVELQSKHSEDWAELKQMKSLHLHSKIQFHTQVAQKQKKYSG